MEQSSASGRGRETVTGAGHASPERGDRGTERSGGAAKHLARAPSGIPELTSLTAPSLSFSHLWKKRADLEGRARGQELGRDLEKWGNLKQCLWGMGDG